MSDTLPEGWRRVIFGDVVRNPRETSQDPLADGFERYVGVADVESENLHIQSWGLIEEDGTSFTRVFRAGQVLFSKRRAYQRKVAVADFDGICSGDLLVFEPKNDDLLPELLPFIVQSDGFFDHALSTSAGSLSPRTKWRDLASYEFALPPLGEQRRIAQILWAADEVTQKTVVIRESLSQSKRVLMRDLFVPELLQSQAQDFRMLSLGEVLTYASDGPFGSNLKTEHYTDSGARVVRLQNIGQGFFDDSDRAYIAYDYYEELSRYALFPGDILVAGLGDDAHPVGRACLVPVELVPAINKADCFCLRADRDIVDEEYLRYYLNSPLAQVQIQRVAQGTTRLRVNVTNLQTIPVPVPDKEQQISMCELLRRIDQTHAEAAHDFEIKRRLQMALCNHLLGGKV